MHIKIARNEPRQKQQALENAKWKGAQMKTEKKKRLRAEYL